MVKTCSWDIEIAAMIPDGRGVNWSDYRPFGITCAAIWTGEGVHTFVPERDTADGPYDRKMSVGACDVMLDVLMDYQARGYDVVTWNGGYFDFDVLAEECSKERFADVVALAKGHVDPGLQMLREMGFMCGLASAAEGCGLGGKTMQGKMAPIYWNTKDLAKQEEVVTYVQGDARLTGQVYLHILAQGGLPYISKRHGTLEQWIPRAWREGNRLLTVEEVGTLNPPRNPWKTYEEATKWMQQPR